MRPWKALENIAVLLGTLFVGTVLNADDGFLERRGTELYLNGKPLYEISFNKFDLVWQLVAAESRTTGFGMDPGASAEVALHELHDFGFKTFRVFGGMPEQYFDTAKREKYPLL